MGYRSDVSIAMAPEYAKGFMDMVDGLGGTPGLDDAADFIRAGIVENGVNGLLLEWNDVKWYDGASGYDEVNAVMDYLHHLPRDAYLLSGLGEDGERWTEGCFVDNPYFPLDIQVRIYKGQNPFGKFRDKLERIYGPERTGELLREFIDGQRQEYGPGM